MEKLNCAGKVVIDVQSIPASAKEQLAKATYEAVMRFMSLPGGREMLEARIAQMKTERS